MNVKIIDAEWEEIPPIRTIKEPWYIDFLYKTGQIMTHGFLLIGGSIFIGRLLGLLIYGR